MITHTIHRGLHWIGFTEDEKDNVSEKPFKWGEEEFPVGTSFTRLGVKERTSLSIGIPIVFRGYFQHQNLVYTLFEVPSKQQEQLQIFEQPTFHWFIAPMSVDNNCLLMPSSPNSFYDIRP